MAHPVRTAQLVARLTDTTEVMVRILARERVFSGLKFKLTALKKQLALWYMVDMLHQDPEH